MSQLPEVGTRFTVDMSITERGENVLKYQIVIDDLRLAIKNGTYPAYSQLPSVSKLCEQY